MARPDVRFNTPPSVPGPELDVRFSDPASETIDLREGPGLSEAEARSILGVGPDASWAEVSAAFANRSSTVAAERRKLNTAYATLRLLAVD